MSEVKSNHQWNRQPVKTRSVYIYKSDIEGDLWWSIQQQLCKEKPSDHSFKGTCNPHLPVMELTVIKHEHQTEDE